MDLPAWVLLDCFVRHRDDDSFPADDLTAVSLSNSRGDQFDVSLRINAPPLPSTFYLRWPNGPKEGEPLDPTVAHGGAVLLTLHYTIPVLDGIPYPMIDYVVYRPAVPSLRLLPPLGGTIDEVTARVEAEGYHTSKQILRRMESMDIGIIHRGPGPEYFAVAELQIDDTGTTARPMLHVFNPSVSNQWISKLSRVVPMYGKDDLDLDNILQDWETDAVIPVGSWLCWVDYTAGIMLCKVFEEAEIPEVFFLELPVKQPGSGRYGVNSVYLVAHNVLGPTKEGDVLMFAQVLPHDIPSHDGVIISRTNQFRNCFDASTWSLRLALGKKMVWQKESEVTADELRDLPEFKDLQIEVPLYPTFSLDDPNIVTFVFKKDEWSYEFGEVWLISIDMKNKIVKSSILYTKNCEDGSSVDAELFKRKIRWFEPFLPVEFPNTICSLKDLLQANLLQRGNSVRQR